MGFFKPVTSVDQAETRIAGGMVAISIFAGLEISNFLLGYLFSKSLFEIEDNSTWHYELFILGGKILFLIFIGWWLRMRKNYMAAVLMIFVIVFEKSASLYDSISLVPNPTVLFFKASIIAILIFLLVQSIQGCVYIKRQAS